MLEEIGEPENIPAYIEGVKSGESSKRLMGFGHRVYKNFDPRANVMRKTCHEVLKHLKLHNDKTFPIALELEKIALNDEYFIKRKLYPNVDFYSGIVLRALGIRLPCLRPFLPSPAQSGGCRTGMNSTKTRSFASAARASCIWAPRDEN